MSGADEFTAALARIAASARVSNLARAEQVAQALAEQRAGRLGADARETAARAAHQLAGSAGTFGDLAVVDPARRLEAHFTDGGSRPGESAQADLDAVLTALGAGSGR